jgi:hypothetical protein
MISFEQAVDGVLTERDKAIWEGVILNVNTMISSAISVPEGQYRVLLKDSDICQLVPTSEAAANKTYEVYKPTLAGFFNPEVHRKVVVTNGKFIAEGVK